MENTETSPKGRIRPAYILAAAGACLAVFLLVFFFGSRIPGNPRIAGVEVGGMNRMEAKRALQPVSQALSSQSMTVLLPRETVELAPEDTGIRLKMFSVIQAAFQQGSGDVDIRKHLKWDESSIVSPLESYAARYNTAGQESSFCLEGPAPQLSEAALCPEGTGQTLTVTLGIPEYTLDIPGLYQQILLGYSQGSFTVDWRDTAPAMDACLPDWDALYLNCRTQPENAVLDLQTGAVTPASYGCHFDLGRAKVLSASAGPGETLQLPMEYIKPEVLTEDLYFQDVLGSYTSGHSDRPSIVHNLDLVCQFLDGIVIQPGEVFSYNDAVGERTVERGFYYGESFTGFERSRSAGGGVCQASSVLHVAVLEADLEVVERVCHGMVVGYTPLGQDAAVSWPGPDFRFRNNTDFPIRIDAKNDMKNIRIRLLGTDTKDYYVILEATQGHDDHQIYANCYKQKYSKETNQLLSRELAVHSAYQYNG